MIKRKLLLTLCAVFGLGLVFSMAFAGVTHATDIRTGDKPTLASNEITDSTLFAGGESVLVAGTVKGDLFCAGSNIDITGTVEGDVICAGQAIRVTGNVLGDVRVAGQSIEIDSQVDGSVTAMGESIIVTPEARIGRDITFGGNRVAIEGAIERDVFGASEAAIISGTIGRTFDAEVTQLTLDAKARIGGDLNYRSPSQAQIASGAQIAGETRYTESNGRDQQGYWASMRWWGALYGFLAMLMIGLVALLFTPRALDAVGSAVRTRSLVSFAAGAAALIATPIIAVGLFASVFGIPLGIMLILLWIVGLIGSYVAAAYALGWFVVAKIKWPARGRRLASLVTGLLILGILGLIPLVGAIAIFLLMVSGFGAFVIAGAAKVQTPKLRKGKK